MKAITVRQFGGPEVLEFADIPRPEPGARDVLVRMRYAGVNPNDAYVRVGNYGFLIPDLPYTPGFDGAGTVEAVGATVTRVKPGDPVFITGAIAEKNTGTYAQFAVVSADAVHRLPEGATFEQGAALGIPALAAYRALFVRGELKAGETVLIHGATGGVGTLAVQMAKAAGASVAGTSGTDTGKQNLKELGCDLVLDHIKADNLEAALVTLRGGPDLIIEFLADVNLQTDLALIKKYGRIVVVGSRGDVTVTPRFTMAKESDIRGMAVFLATPEENRQALAAIADMLEKGQLRPVIGEVRPLKDASDVHKTLLTQKGKGKTLLEIPEH